MKTVSFRGLDHLSTETGAHDNKNQLKPQKSVFGVAEFSSLLY